ncbi:hypothetical protein SKAU_G00300840 [Synaphobranchus kaupii]|uniref:Uncharacterized protein n=1 Tax=Synaphobranchus kaupii TaxID=118154 RepID=A0A9Q1EVJ4_SYNKA|nr:hypothetical protein SKAU_G00300840 [Synaphobranchus kaupii]
MSAGSLAGLVVYRLDKRGHVSEKNPTRVLDVALLLGASLGQMVICHFTAVAVAATGNLFVIEGLHRRPFDEAHAVEATPPACVAVIETKSHAVMAAAPAPQPSLSWQRWALKEICAFLLLGNIILWIMPAFGARPPVRQPDRSGFLQVHHKTAGRKLTFHTHV